MIEFIKSIIDYNVLYTNLSIVLIIAYLFVCGRLLFEDFCLIYAIINEAINDTYLRYYLSKKDYQEKDCQE